VHNTEKTLALMSTVFGTPDNLLRQVGMITLYYHLFRFVKLKNVGAIKRDWLAQFDKKREKNRQIVEQKGEQGGGADLSLLEFDKHSQTPNDAYALRIRLDIMLRFLNKHFNVKFDKAVLQEAV
jgi:hypothetical protein